MPSLKQWAQKASRLFSQQKPQAPSPYLSLYQELNRNSSAGEIVMRKGISFKLHPQSIEGAEYFCYRNSDNVAEMDSFIRHAAGRKAFLDIGALHGVFSLVFTRLNPSGHTIAVDASPAAFAKLLYNIHKNSFDEIIKPIESAVSNSSGTLKMHYEWEHLVAAKDLAPKLRKNKTKPAEIAIEKLTGDEICEKNNFLPDTIKIDVEGHEVKVLEGLSKTISALKPIIFLEIHPPRIASEGDSIQSIDEFASKYGYKITNFDGSILSAESLKNSQQEHRVILLPHARP